jgi:hypothetical protein
MGVPLSLPEALAGAAGSHKNQDVGRPVLLPVELGIDPAKEGGCFVAPDGTCFTVRAPRWRPIEGDPIARATDIMLLYGLSNAQSSQAQLGRLGLEVEGWVLDGRTSEPIDATEPDDPRPELFSAAIEEATSPTNDMFGAGLQLHDAIVRLRRRAAKYGGVLYPGSNIAHRRLGVEDTNPHPYVQRIARFMGGMLKLAQLDGASVQPTTETTGAFAAGVFAANQASRRIALLMNRYTAASPFAGGEAVPEFGEGLHYNLQRGCLTTRIYGRLKGSKEAGPFLEPLPTDEDAYIQLTHERMRSGAMPSGGRTGGQHRDMRVRPDHGPKGAIEWCSLDTDGGMMQSLMAVSTLARSFGFLMEESYMNGRVEYLEHSYPRIFRADLTKQDFAEALVDAQLLAQDSPGLKLKNFSGGQSTPRELYLEYIAMVANEVKEPDYKLSQGAEWWLRRRTETPTLTGMAKNRQGIVSARGFYRGGPGVLAQYQKARYNQLIATGHFTVSEAIVNVQLDTASCYEEYCRNFNPERDLAFLYAVA